MPAGLLTDSRCFFGGGTAIVLANGEYRLSLDVDFLCSDTNGYRELRTLAVKKGARAFFGADVHTIRQFRCDQYGLRAMLSLHGQIIKFEVVREGRIGLDGRMDDGLGVPVLAVGDQFAEKLLANADRYGDRSVACRDAIDLGYLARRTGAIPPEAIAKAEGAYGEDIARKVAAVLQFLASPDEEKFAAETLGMKPDDVRTAVAALRSAALSAWDGLGEALGAGP